MKNAVLIVDDDPDFRRLVVGLLQTHGYTCHEAATVREGLSEAARVAPSVVVIDGILPDNRGDAMIRELRSRGFNGLFVFVSSLLAGRDDGTLEQLRMQLGAEAVLRKPLDPMLLIDSIERAFRRVAQGEAVDPPPFGAGVPLTAVPDESRQERAKKAVDEIQKLKLAYARKLVPLFYELLGSIAAVRTLDVAEFEKPRRLSHRIAGTAGTYGYTRVGQTVGEIEELLTILKDSNERARPALLEILERRLDSTARTIIEELSEKAGSRV